MPTRTVSGPVVPESLGAVLMHEHIDSIALPGFHSGGRHHPDELVVESLSCLGEQGVRTLVDLTGRSRVVAGHDMGLVRRVAPRLAARVVIGFSYYKDPWLGHAGDGDLDRLTSLYVDAAEHGPGGLPVGIYGEVGTSLEEITDREERHLRAVARAHRETGLGIYTHCTLGTMAMEQAEILAGEGADLERVVLGHLDLSPDVAYLERVLATGATIGFDTFGKEWFDYRVPGSEGQGDGAFVKWAYRRPDEERLRALVELCRRGHAERIVLSCDISGAEAWMNPSTHGRHGFAFLPGVIIPRLREAGVGEEALHRMLVENPARILTVP